MGGSSSKVEDGGSQLYPGNGRPAFGFYGFSCIKDYLEIVPSIFNYYCQDVLSEKARYAYWMVPTEEKSLTEEQQLVLLNEAISQSVTTPCSRSSHDHETHTRLHCCERVQALDFFNTLTSCWDKRRSSKHWVGQGHVSFVACEES